MVNEFRLPDVGEGLTEAELVSWHVQVGDEIKINDIICEIETAKSVVELPSPYAGTVQALLVPEAAIVGLGRSQGTVWTVEDGALQQRAVTLGHRLLDGRFEITGGVPAGAAVITELTGGMRAGRAVRIADGPAK